MSKMSFRFLETEKSGQKIGALTEVFMAATAFGYTEMLNIPLDNFFIMEIPL